MVIAVASEEMIFHMDDTVITMKVLIENSALSGAAGALIKYVFHTIYLFCGNLGNCTHIWWRTINGLTPHRFRMITDAETADRRSRHIQKTMFNSSALKVRTILLQGV